MTYPIWERLKAGNRYVYTLVNRKHLPILFDSNTGTFRVYISPNTNSHSFDTYITPELFNTTKSNTVNDNNPVLLKEVLITAKKPVEFAGILRTPDDHWAALARDRAVDEKVNPQNDLLQSFFANLMTGGMYSAVDLGTKNLAKGNYLEGAALTATPIMFGPAESTVANLTRLGVGAYDLLSNNGVKKTYNLAKLGNLLGATKSAVGDALNLGMTIGGGYNLGKYNIPSFVLLAARNGNNTARSYLISKELNLNVKNFDGTVGEEYFLNPVPGRWIRISETPEVGGLKEMGKNVTTTDAYNIHVPSNDWRMNHIKDFTFKNGEWYKKPKKRFSLSKMGSAHGDTSLAAYGKVWEGTTALSKQFPQVRLEGEAPNQMYRGFDPATGADSRTNFVLLNTEDIPIGSRIGFHTGEMPMENLLYFLLLPNGRWAIKGLILPNKTLYVNTPATTRYLFDNPTYQMYTGPQHDISEVINSDGSVNLKNLLNILKEALKNIPGGTIARHRLENKQWHPTDWNTFLHTRDVYRRALLYNYPKEALFPALMHDAGKLWTGEGHGPYGASIIQLIFPKASKEQISAIYGHMEANPRDQLTRLVKGVDIKEPNQFRYLPNLFSTSKSTTNKLPYYLLFKHLNQHLLGEDAVKMFKEYGGEKIPENSINGPLLRAYVNEAREVYGLLGNTNITDEEIAQALYKLSKELSKNSKVVNELGEPQLLFRGDTKDYTTLKDRPSPNDMINTGGTMDNSLGTLFLGEYPGFRGDRFDSVGASRYLNGWYFNPITQKFEFRFSSTGHPGSSLNMQRSYLMFNNNKGWRGESQAFIKAKSTKEYPNHLNLFISRSPELRDATKEVSVLDDDFLLSNGTSSKSKANYLGSEHTISPEFEMKRNDGTSLGEITAGDSRIPELREVMADHYTNLLKDAETKNLGILKSSADSPLREEHTAYSYFAVPNFAKFDVKHILPYDLRIPRNWKDPNIFRSVIPIGLGLNFNNYVSKKDKL